MDEHEATKQRIMARCQELSGLTGREIFAEISDTGATISTRSGDAISPISPRLQSNETMQWLDGFGAGYEQGLSDMVSKMGSAMA